MTVSRVSTPAEMFQIKYMLTEKVEIPTAQIPPVESTKIGRKSLLNSQQFNKFMELVKQYETTNLIKMTWKQAAKAIQDILNRQTKVPRTSAARYLKLAEIKANLQ